MQSLSSKRHPYGTSNLAAELDGIKGMSDVHLADT